MTYSLLAHINNKSNADSNYEDIFIPLVKRGLSKMCAAGQYKGDDINDIRRHIDELYGLEMPEPILKKMLSRIGNELNADGRPRVHFYSGGSFIINEFVFDEYEDEILKRNRDLEGLQKVYNDFLRMQDIEDGSLSIFGFVEQHKLSLGKYISREHPPGHEDNTIEARFVEFIRSINEFYKVLQSVYIGSIISTYLEYKPVQVKKNVELVLDTNFIVSLLDLNTSSSTSNCQRLIEIGSVLGYKFSVLAITMREIDNLLKTRIDLFDSVFLPKLMDAEDIYNACSRRNLTKTDLERIRAGVEKEIGKFGIVIISNTEKYENKAKYSDEYERLKTVRNSSFAALHDSTCAEYIKAKRGRIIHEFDKVNCWFVNNSSSRSASYFVQGAMPLSIKAEDLLNLLWLTSPMVKSRISAEDLSSIGLSRLVCTTLSDTLPSAGMIRELDDNIQKYAKDEIVDEDIVRVSRAIARKTVNNFGSLIDLAASDRKKFVDKLQSIANHEKEKQEEFKKRLVRFVNGIEKHHFILGRKIEVIDKKKQDYDETINLNSELLEDIKKIRSENLRLKNAERKKLRRRFIKRKVFHWRLRSFLPFMVLPLLVIICWGLIQPYVNGPKGIRGMSVLSVVAAAIYSGIFIKIFADKFNQSTINAYLSTIEIPEDLRPLTDN